MNLKFSYVVVFVALVGCSSPSEISVATQNGDGLVLKENVGIETLGGVFTPLLKTGCKLPCEITQVFSTADDNQNQIMIHLFQGTAPMVSEAKRLGVFRVSGISLAPRGTPQVAVSFIADTERVVLRAVDKQSKDNLKWTRVDQ